MRWFSWLAGLLVCALPLLAAEGKDDRPARAKALIEALAKKDFASAVRHFDEKLNKLLDRDRLEEIGKKLHEQLGALKKTGELRTEKRGGANIVVIPCHFDKMMLDLQVTFDKDDRISGFVFVPGKGTFTYKPPPYARAGSYREVDFVVNAAGKWPLPATLTLPQGAGPFPAVVLVHGSGPHDRDETLGPNKPFRDLAWGLASQGVAVLRYAKRAHEHAARVAEMLPRLTLHEETVEDAVAAVQAVRKHKGIDPERVFVLGHSLGAFAAPRIARADARLAGIILLAGNSRPLEDLVIEQFTYLFGLEGKISEENQKRLDAIRKQVARVKADLPADTPAHDLPLNLPATYWRDLKAYNPSAMAAELKQPILILQGERDYQVTMADFAGWKKALKGHRAATLKSYPNLNHLFMDGKGKSTPADYQKAGHIDRAVIDDIVAWLRERR